MAKETTNPITRLLSYIKKVVYEQLRGPLFDSDNSHRITIDLELPAQQLWPFVGRCAGELREMGMQIKATIPDCAILKAVSEGGMTFTWVELKFTLEGDN